MIGSEARATSREWATWPVGILLVASLAACAYGLVATDLLVPSRWVDPGPSLRGAVVIAIALGLLQLLAVRLRLAPGVVAVAAGALAAACFAGIGATATVLLQLLAGFCIGRRVLPDPPGNADLPPGMPANAITAVAIGLAVLSFVVGLMSFLPVNNAAWYLALLLVPVAWGWRGHRDALVLAARAWSSPAVPRPGTVIIVLHGVVAFALVLRLLAVLHPEIGTDALAMHLVIAEQMQADGRFHYDVGQSIWAVMPMASDWQFALAHMLGGEPAARLANLAADLLVVGLVHQVALRAAGALAAAAAAALYATTPLLYLETSSLFVENFWTLWFVAALVAGLRGVASGGIREALATGLLVGTALAAKVISVFLAPFFAALAVAWILRWRGRGVAMLATCGAAVVAMAIVPYANAWWRTGNPVFPFMNQLFGSPYFDQARAFDNSLFHAGATWRTLYDATFASGNYLEAYPGALGLAFLAFLPAAAAWALLAGWRERIAILCGLLFVACVFQFQSYLRYILPVLPVFAVLMGASVATLGRHALWRPLVVAAVLACALAGLYLTPSSNFLHRSISLPPFNGTEAAERYLDRHRPERRLARIVDAMQFRRVLWLGQPYIAGSDTDVGLTNWHGGWEQARAFAALGSAAELQQWIASNKYEAIAVTDDYHLCERQFVCDFLDGKTTKVYQDGDMSLHVPDRDVLFLVEMLVNGGFDAGIEGWSGTGTYLPGAGAVRVTATTPFSQPVPVQPGASYALEVEGACPGGAAAFRSQVNWATRGGDFLGTDIAVVECDGGEASHATVVVAPEDAATAIVYASGHAPEQPVEITRVSFRQ